MTIAAAAVQSGNSPTVIGRIFPRRIDNKFEGHWLAIGLLVLYAAIKFGQGTVSILDTASTAVRADGISLTGFGAMGAQTVISMFALLGVNVLVLPLQAVLVLIRYRAMIPLMYLMMAGLYLAGRALSVLHPFPHIDGAVPTGSYVNLSLFAILLAGFSLSLVGRPER